MAVETLSKRESLSLEDAILYSVDLEIGTKRLAGFCVVQLMELNAETREVVKFDAAHGKCHVHRYCKFVEHKEAISGEISPETMNMCIDDIMKNWKKYRGWYLKSL